MTYYEQMCDDGMAQEREEQYERAEVSIEEQKQIAALRAAMAAKSTPKVAAKLVYEPDPATDGEASRLQAIWMNAEREARGWSFHWDFTQERREQLQAEAHQRFPLPSWIAYMERVDAERASWPTCVSCSQTIAHGSQVMVRRPGSDVDEPTHPWCAGKVRSAATASIAPAVPSMINPWTTSDGRYFASDADAREQQRTINERAEREATRRAAVDARAVRDDRRTA